MSEVAENLTQQPVTTESTGESTTTPVTSDTLIVTKTPNVVTSEPAPVATPPQNFPDNWRELALPSGIEGDDKEKALGMLGRFTDPGQMTKSLLEANRMISQKSEDWRPALPDDPTDKDVEAYRDAMHVPQEASGYRSALPEGMVFSDKDNSMLESYFGSMHEANIPGEAVAQSLGWLQNWRSQVQQQQEVNNSDAKVEAEEALRADWGGDFLKYKNNIGAVLNKYGDADSVNALLNSVQDLESGVGTFNNAGVLRMLATMANDLNPTGVLINGEIPTDNQAIDTELDEIRKVMREDRPKYDKDTKMQERMRQLLDETERRKQAARQ